MNLSDLLYYPIFGEPLSFEDNPVAQEGINRIQAFRIWAEKYIDSEVFSSYSKDTQSWFLELRDKCNNEIADIHARRAAAIENERNRRKWLSYLMHAVNIGGSAICFAITGEMASFIPLGLSVFAITCNYVNYRLSN